MKWFGIAPWGPPCNGGEHVDVPIGLTCIYCDESFARGDMGGFLIAVMGTIDGAGEFTPSYDGEYPIHAECLIRQRFGSVRHQRGECSGDGSCQALPDGMSVRQDANLAAAYFLRRVETVQAHRARVAN